MSRWQSLGSRRLPEWTAKPRAAWKEARKAEGRKHKAPKSFTVAQLLDQWLKWRETNGKDSSPSTIYNYRLIYVRIGATTSLRRGEICTPTLV